MLITFPLQKKSTKRSKFQYGVFLFFDRRNATFYCSIQCDKALFCRRYIKERINQEAMLLFSRQSAEKSVYGREANPRLPKDSSLGCVTFYGFPFQYCIKPAPEVYGNIFTNGNWNNKQTNKMVEFSELKASPGEAQGVQLC